MNNTDEIEKLIKQQTGAIKEQTVILEKRLYTIIVLLVVPYLIGLVGLFIVGVGMLSFNLSLPEIKTNSSQYR